MSAHRGVFATASGKHSVVLDSMINVIEIRGAVEHLHFVRIEQPFRVEKCISNAINGSNISKCAEIALNVLKCAEIAGNRKKSATTNSLQDYSR